MRCFIVFLYEYIHSFIFPEMAVRGATATLATRLNPSLSTVNTLGASILLCLIIGKLYNTTFKGIIA